MNTDESIDLFNDLDDYEQTENFINKDKRRQRFPERHFKVVRAANAEFLKGQDDSSRSFNFAEQSNQGDKHYEEVVYAHPRGLPDV